MFYKILKDNKAPVTTVFGSNEYIYKINEINISNHFDATTMHGNGLYFADEKNILNFLGYGDTLYEVEIPNDAIVIEINDACKEFKTNKLILKNPKKITPELIKDFLANGATISSEKMSGVIYDLGQNNQKEIMDLIFELIDENNAKLAIELFSSDATKYYHNFVEKYSNTTNPEVISIIHNNYQYNRLYNKNDSTLEKLILTKIQKNLQKPIKDILNEYEKTLINEEVR